MLKKLVQRKRFFVITAVLLFFSLGFVGNLTAPIDNYFEISKNLDIFGKLYREVNAFYVDDIDPNKFMRAGIDGMLEGLDPYTNFISASEIEDYRFMSTGQYGGIGAMISRRDGKVIITEPYEGYPAAEAGLLAGDVILKIDNDLIKDLDSETLDVRDLLRGQPDSKVIMTIQRDGFPEPLIKEVIREEIKIKNVPFSGMINDDIGYISLAGFTREASKEVRLALEGLKAINPGLKGVVLDVRGNPGGLLFEAVDISNIFVDQGETIVETRGKIEGSLNVYKAKNPPVDKEIPLVVLINKRSASASEIVSGVMQDLDRAVIVGQRSFGKGLVQTTRPLSYNTQLKITTAKYYTPSGRCIQAINYADRDEEGSVSVIPDSLKKEFKTRIGRSVFDGGGIEPDIHVEIPEFHTITKELIKRGVIFDFATKFRLKNETIPGPREFEITDQIFNEFVAFVKEKEFSFETKTEKELARMVVMLKEEGYYDDLENQLTTIENAITREKGNDLKAYRDEIAVLLTREIITRYYYRSGEIQASFGFDPDITEAIKVLKDQGRFKTVLGEKP